MNLEQAKQKAKDYYENEVMAKLLNTSFFSKEEQNSRLIAMREICMEIGIHEDELRAILIGCREKVNK